MINYLQLSRKIMPLYCVIVQECGATDCFHALCLPFRYWALSKVQTLCLDVDIGQTWKDSFRCDEMTPQVSYCTNDYDDIENQNVWVWRNFPLVRTWFQPSWRWFGNMVPYSRKASKHSKAFCQTSSSNSNHPQITNWLRKKNFSPRVFVNSIFEIEKNHSLPETKTELLE